MRLSTQTLLLTPRNSVRRGTLLLLLGGLALSVAIAAWSLVYWGYFLFPPALDGRIIQLAQILAVEEYRYSTDAQIAPVPLPQHATEAKICRFSFPEDRVLALLVQRGVPMPRATEVASVERRQLVKALGLESDIYTGRFFVGRNDLGETILILTGSSYPLDHRRYTEVVVALDPAGELKERLSCRKFNYDSAGVEWLSPSVLYLAGMVVLLCCTAIMSGVLYIQRGGLRVTSRHSSR